MSPHAWTACRPVARRVLPWAGVAVVFLLVSWLVGAPAAGGAPPPVSGPAVTAVSTPALQAGPVGPAAGAAQAGVVAVVPAAGAAATGAVAGVPDACVHRPPKAKRPPDKPLWEKLIPIGLLLGVIALVVRRLPKVDLGHSPAFRRRRTWNWLPLGLTYAFLYMARYNLNQFMYIGAITEREFGAIFGIGSTVYGVAFLLNGPLTDLLGGRVTILLSAAGAAASNAAIGYMVLTGHDFGDRITALTVLYAANMYFQSFGAVSIVKVNAAWFHVRERGTFGGIFGILISLGLFFGYDGSKLITDSLAVHWLFFIPAGLLVLFFTLSYLFVRDNPSETGHADFDPGDASSGDDGARPSVRQVMWKVVSNPIILTIAFIELCSGFLRQAILQWGRNFGKGVGLADSFVFQNWGVMSCIAGITGGMFAGAISDHLFQSRRGPVSAVLYAFMLAGALSLFPLFAAAGAIPWVVILMSMAIIGVHGMLSGTASQDFGGKKNAGIAVGIIDGFVYVGSMLQSFLYGAYLPAEKIACPDGTRVANPAAKIIDNWKIWPLAMIPVALVGLVLALRVWNARPRPKSAAGEPPKAAALPPRAAAG